MVLTNSENDFLSCKGACKQGCFWTRRICARCTAVLQETLSTAFRVAGRDFNPHRGWRCSVRFYCFYLYFGSRIYSLCLLTCTNVPVVKVAPVFQVASPPVASPPAAVLDPICDGTLAFMCFVFFTKKIANNTIQTTNPINQLKQKSLFVVVDKWRASNPFEAGWLLTCHDPARYQTSQTQVRRG